MRAESDSAAIAPLLFAPLGPLGPAAPLLFAPLTGRSGPWVQ